MFYVNIPPVATNTGAARAALSRPPVSQSLPNRSMLPKPCAQVNAITVSGAARPWGLGAIPAAWENGAGELGFGQLTGLGFAPGRNLAIAGIARAPTAAAGG